MKASIVINTNANIYTDINIHISIHTPTNMNTHTLMNGRNNISKNTDTKHLYIAKASLHNTNTNITMKTPTNTNNHVHIDSTCIHTIPAYTNVYKIKYHRVYV